MMNKWPKEPIYWLEEKTLYISIPFTWDLPEVRAYLKQKAWSWDKAIVGGPAVQLMPDFFGDMDYVIVGDSYPGILQKVNPVATRTTTGCIRKCAFCGIGQSRIEAGGFKELDDWPDLPIICDNNLLAASQSHFDKVIDRLKKWADPDFNQGLDARLLTSCHAKRLAELNRPKIRLSCDSIHDLDSWLISVDMLISAGVKKSYIHTYALIGFNSNPDEAWTRCEQIQKNCAACYPMWYHPLDALQPNQVTKEQAELGWTDEERIRIMRRFYKAKYGGYESPVSVSNLR